MVSLPIDRVGLEILPFDDCIRLLDSVPVGRVGFFAHGEVVILPVNFLVDGQDVVFRTGEGSLLSSVASRRQVGFEADFFDARTRSGWSVVVSGFTDVVESDDEIARLDDLGLDTWGNESVDRTWVRIRPESVTGRRTYGAAFSG
jgi:nitroimidazol reductase NimA-like FMN-containing flavoprotein (pyridoxamine 5'-phosphate oxidase superfamily)